MIKEEINVKLVESDHGGECLKETKDISLESPKFIPLMIPKEDNPSEIAKNETPTELPKDESIDSNDYSAEDEQNEAINILNKMNNEMQTDETAKSSNEAESISNDNSNIAETRPVTISNPRSIKIINGSDLVNKSSTGSNNTSVARIINVAQASPFGESREFIKLLPAKSIRKLQAIPLSTNLTPTKIIRIKSEKEYHKMPITTLSTTATAVIPKKVVTIQANPSSTATVVNRSPIHIQKEKNSGAIHLSSKSSTSSVGVLSKSSNVISNSSASKPSNNYIFLTSNLPLLNRSADHQTAPVVSSALSNLANSKASTYDRYDTIDISQRRAMRAEANGSNTTSTWQQYVRQYAHMGPCPICEDSISGYHYGIFCCESCKGFFKRSVQNHKDYVCHVQQSGGDPCVINKHTRKKCPSCRFQRCIEKGMRIEAVRNDRSRGGRSLYPGARNRINRYNFPDSVTDEISQKSATTITADSIESQRYVNYIRQVSSNAANNNSSTSNIQQQSLSNSFDYSSRTSNGSLHRALSSRGRTSMMSVLENIVAIEETLSQEEDVLGPVIEDDDMAVYRVLLKLAEQRLHRMVRWSRSLPEFSAIDTDDQILLVQNCWSDLLILDCCYRSLGDPREIHLTSGKCINLDAACELGAKDMVAFILQMTQKLKRLKFDIREFACLKVLLLMQPDLKNLKAEGRVRMFQETVSQLLLDYTTQNYETIIPNKFYDLIMCIPEIRQATNSVKEMLLNKDLTPFLNSNSLLLELLNCNSNTNVNNSSIDGSTTLGNDNNNNSSIVLTIPSSSNTGNNSNIRAQIVSRDVKIIPITTNNSNINNNNGINKSSNSGGSINSKSKSSVKVIDELPSDFQCKPDTVVVDDDVDDVDDDEEDDEDEDEDDDMVDPIPVS